MNEPVINRTLRLPPDQYIGTSSPKDLIALHHTAGGSAASTFSWWKTDPLRIGTAYIIDRDGTIFEVFPPEDYASHLGVKGQFQMERRSVAIEICNYGGLTERDGNLYLYGKLSEATHFKGKVFGVGLDYRGYRYFEAYEDAQIDSVINLVGWLADKFAIPLQTPKDHLTFNPALYNFKGIFAHNHVRADKSDLHPGFDWNKFMQALNIQAV